MLFPLYDEQFPATKTPWATIFLILLNIVVFILPFVLSNFFRASYILYPGDLLNLSNLKTLVTNLFFHLNFWHLFVNVYFLWLFGDNIEHHLGRIRFVALYLASGVVSGLLYAFLVPDKFIPLLGASGAVSGVLGAYLILFFKNKVKALLILPPLVVKFVSIPSVVFLLLWVGLQVVNLFVLSLSIYTYWVHIIGFLVGLALAIILRRKVVIQNIS